MNVNDYYSVVIFFCALYIWLSITIYRPFLHNNKIFPLDRAPVFYCRRLWIVCMPWAYSDLIFLSSAPLLQLCMYPIDLYAVEMYPFCNVGFTFFIGRLRNENSDDLCWAGMSAVIYTYFLWVRMSACLFFCILSILIICIHSNPTRLTERTWLPSMAAALRFPCPVI